MAATFARLIQQIAPSGVTDRQPCAHYRYREVQQYPSQELRHQTTAKFSNGLTVPHSLQLGHCQWWVRAPNPHRVQR